MFLFFLKSVIRINFICLTVPVLDIIKIKKQKQMIKSQVLHLNMLMYIICWHKYSLMLLVCYCNHHEQYNSIISSIWENNISGTNLTHNLITLWCNIAKAVYKIWSNYMCMCNYISRENSGLLPFAFLSVLLLNSFRPVIIN